MKIWTAEDPVEITQYGLRQVQVFPKIGFTFATAMKAFLRADPDIIMVGEMRDHETAAPASKPRSPATWCSPRSTPTPRPKPSPV
jgi:type II secretory ATPase GspE/PulE/Tfp pilus assembly ATPase PilB-like protein